MKNDTLFKQMSKQRFDAYVNFRRLPTFDLFMHELFFFSDQNEDLIGSIFICKTDLDFGFTLFKRNLEYQFEITSIRTDIVSYNLAMILAHKALLEISALTRNGPKVDTQLDLFRPLVNSKQLHHYFKKVRVGNPWAAARGIIREIMPHFKDIDGNFVQQFQTTGFNARLWELFVYSFLKEERLLIDRSHHAPDFLISNGVYSAAIEAVTVNETQIDALANLKTAVYSEDNLNEQAAIGLSGKMHIKYGSAISSKLKKKMPYWELEHVKGLPFAIAIADFHDKQSMTWSTVRRQLKMGQK